MRLHGDQVESVVLGVATGSRVTSFDYIDVASVESTSEWQMCVEEVAADGTVGANDDEKRTTTETLSKCVLVPMKAQLFTA